MVRKRKEDAQLNEQQSWDYQDPEEELTLLSNKKKNALVRYMAILFGVAFLLVLLSFLIQLRDSRETISDLSQANSSALQNAGKLQEDNQRLAGDNEALLRQIESLEAQLRETEETAAQAEKARRDALSELSGVQKTLADQTRAGGRLFEAAEDWLDGERKSCEAHLNKLDREELDEAGQALYDRLQAALAADTAENTEENAENAEGSETEGTEPDGEEIGGQS